MKFGIVYVLCPENCVTGGPDALHQMVFYLNRAGINSKIIYITDKKKKECVSIPNQYKIYVESFGLESDIIDSSENCIVVPESYTRKKNNFKNAKVFIWWLSVNNNLSFGFWKKCFFIVTLPLRMIKNWQYYKKKTLKIVKYVLYKQIYSFKNESSKITHLCASYYAYNYVATRSKNRTVKCIEPISLQFLQYYRQERENTTVTNKKNIILYNPKRGYNNLIKEVSLLAPDLHFEPLQGLTLLQLIEKYSISKLYIDFGAFPGAERIPKEAVLFGCAIITGKRGASGFHGDVPIPEEYKFENPTSQIEEIVTKIRYVLDNYERVYSDFDEYRKTVLNLEDNFITSLKEIFG